ncbi:excinuclease ABC subunit B [Flavobacterium sp.]|uniref:excinuclease ABC subunit B n=1 Tax=Flavobacterium sp. TaxID=239 RepID=UPI00261D4707|nr:excinuclease ABC subunit B [Flavobacterium sp.]MDD2986783.1 excinuclease ABC subunit B [Flavobacterium sp.]
MITYKEKLSLIDDMISLAKIEGVLHPNEMEFIKSIVSDWKIKETDLEELFALTNEKKVLKSEFKRIEHFYRMALLSYTDDFQHYQEENFLYQLGLKLGLNPMAIKRVLDAMKTAPNRTVDSEILIKIFQEQHN